MKKLRYTRKGWFVFWLRMACGTKDIRTGETHPDVYGALWRDIWIGPFATAAEAMQA